MRINITEAFDRFVKTYPEHKVLSREKIVTIETEIEKYLKELKRKFFALDFFVSDTEWLQDGAESGDIYLGIGISSNKNRDNGLYPLPGAVRHTGERYGHWYGYPEVEKKDGSVYIAVHEPEIFALPIIEISLLPKEGSRYVFNQHFFIGQCKCENHKEYMHALSLESKLISKMYEFKKIIRYNEGLKRKGANWRNHTINVLKFMLVDNGPEDFFIGDKHLLKEHYVSYEKKKVKNKFRIATGRYFQQVIYGARFKLCKEMNDINHSTFEKNLRNYLTIIDEKSTESK